MVLKVRKANNIRGGAWSLYSPFSSFPDGLRGLALLWLRMAVALLFARNAAADWSDSRVLACSLLGATALFIGIGLLTPAFSLLATIAEVAWIVAHPTEACSGPFLATSILIALALLGPGGYSIDRYFFGRRKLTIGRPL